MGSIYIEVIYGAALLRGASFYVAERLRAEF